MYDPAVIQEFATRLYAQAQGIAMQYAAYGFIIGFGIGAGALGALGAKEGHIVLLGGAIVGAVCGASGYRAGWAKAFDLRLKAQVALCQLRIEENTRPK